MIERIANALIALNSPQQATLTIALAWGLLSYGFYRIITRESRNDD
jgi:hypothetical protein